MSPSFNILLRLLFTGFAAAQSTSPFLNPGFNISAVAALAQVLPTHSWEYGTATEALLETKSSNLSVFGASPFPVPTLDPSSIPALVYGASHLVIGINGLDNGSGAVGDPASLGVAAVMLAKTNATIADAAQREINYLLGTVPRWPNGAISQRADVAELWCVSLLIPPLLFAISYF